MAGEFSTWLRVKDTHNPETAELSTSSIVPFGMLKKRELTWTAEGAGAGNAFYKITVVESWFKGLVATLAEPDRSFDVNLHKRVPGEDSHKALNTQYIAHLTTRDLVTVTGHTAEIDAALSAEEQFAQLIKPDFMTPQEAADGFKIAMADARFS